MWWALAGLLLGLNLFTLLTLVLARPAGMGLMTLSVGVGRPLGSAVVRGVGVTVRLVPFILLIPHLVVLDRPGVARRLWLTMAARMLTLLGVSTALIVSGGTGPRLAGYGCAAITLVLLLANAGRETGVGWVLFRLPRKDGARRLAEWVFDPASVAAVRAMSAGRLDEARQVLGAAAPSAGNRRRAAMAALAWSEGRLDEAARQALALYADSESPALRAGTLRLYASALADGAAAGQWAPEAVLPQVAAVRATMGNQLPAARGGYSDLAALEALLRGETARAAHIAASTARTAPDAFGRARALAIRAQALSLLGQAGRAHALLARARELAPGLHRVAVAEARLRQPGSYLRKPMSS
jgi:hypothetical protein